MAKKPSMKSNFSTEEEEKTDKAVSEGIRKMLEDDAARDVKAGRPYEGLPAIVRNKGKVDPEATGRLSAKNYQDALREEYKNPDSARARAKKNYNVPPQITEEDRQRGRDETARTKREMTSDSDIPASDKEIMSKMIENEEGFKRGGSVRKYAEGGLVRGSVRGGGVALRGLGKGKVY
jgi:hypothetical protein